MNQIGLQSVYLFLRNIDRINNNFYCFQMSFGVQPKKLKKLIDLYRPLNFSEEMKYMLHLRGEQELYINLQTCPFQGISNNSLEDRLAVFGSNEIQFPKSSFLKILSNGLSRSYISLPIFFSLLNIIYSITRSIIDQSSIWESLLLFSVTLLNLFLRCMEEIYFQFNSQIRLEDINNQLYCVIRQNKRLKIPSCELVVGDILQLKEGDIIPVDGWLIEGYNVIVIEKFFSANQVKKDCLKKCISDMKVSIENEYQNDTAFSFDDIKSKKSPVVLSGSEVKAGQGKMIVLCVGELSRRGEQLLLSQPKFKSNILKNKIEEVNCKIVKYLTITSFIFCGYQIVNLILKLTIDKNFIPSNWNQWQVLIIGVKIILVGVPQGLSIGLLIGAFCIKIRLWINDKIWVQYCQNITKMALITEICYDKEKNWGKTYCKQWWNQNTCFFTPSPVQMEIMKKQDMKILESEEDNIDLEDCSDNFRDLMNASLKLRHSNQPLQQYYLTQESIFKKNVKNEWNIFEESSQQQKIIYMCQGNTIKYITMLDKEKQNGTLFVKGQSEEIMDKCSHIMYKSSGERGLLTIEKRAEISDIIKSMNKRLVATFAIAYQSVTDITLQTSIESILQKQMTFLCLLGVSGTKDHTQYQIVRKLKETNVNMILVSSKCLMESINRSKYIGINTIEQDSLALEGEEFMNIVGGVVCNVCKKSLCVCEDKSNHRPKLKNLEEFRRITKYLKVMSNATFLQKYALLVGYQNIHTYTAFMSSQQQDAPALASSYLSITSSNEMSCNNTSVIFPNNSLTILFNFINWSRFGIQFTRRYLTIMLPACLVPSIIMIISGVFFDQNPFTLSQLLWVILYVCPVLALNLSLEKIDQSNMHQNQSQFSLSSKLITQPVNKQIISQTVMQIIVLLLIMVSGQLYIAQGPDSVDSLISANWQAKYNNINKDTVASGLYCNPLFNSPSYEPTFETYDIPSKHLTIVYNIYVLMQIFNYFNSRKIKDNQINVLEGIEIQNILVFIFVVLSHYLFITLCASFVGLYPESLTLQQWLVSSAFAMIVWLVGFVVRLFPNSNKQIKVKRIWVNKSYNLGVKLVNKKLNLAEFEVEEDIQFKYK